MVHQLEMRTAALIVAVVAFLASPPSFAETPVTVADEVQRQVMSPFCPGRLLADCPSASASELKLEILGEAERGKKADQIVAELAAKYGDEIRATPAFSGFALLAWLIPLLFLGTGALVLLWWLWRNRTDTVKEEADLCDVADYESDEP